MEGDRQKPVCNWTLSAARNDFMAQAAHRTVRFRQIRHGIEK
jgi:hypothetical protein